MTVMTALRVTLTVLTFFMNSKSLLIAIAAFAVTATSAQAFVGSEVLRRAGLSGPQIEAIHEARYLRASGEIDKARDILVDAGVDADALAKVRAAAKENRLKMNNALVIGDFKAFTEAIEETPLADIITSEADFLLFKEAHNLRKSGAHGEAAEIFSDLGVNDVYHGNNYNHERGRGLLTDEQQAAMRIAQQANDRETVRAILDEAGENSGWGGR